MAPVATVGGRCYVVTLRIKGVERTALMRILIGSIYVPCLVTVAEAYAEIIGIIVEGIAGVGAVCRNVCDTVSCPLGSSRGLVIITQTRAYRA